MTETNEPVPLTPEQIAQQNAATVRKLAFFARTVTQGEWLQIQRLMDCDRDAIAADRNLQFLALAWVKHKRNGGAGIDALFNMTDEEIAAEHGYIIPALDDYED